MKNWKHGIVAVITAIAFVSLSCASSPKVSALMSLDEAIEGAAVAIEGRVKGGSEIAVYKIDAPRNEIGDYLADNLNDKISMRGNLVPLARGKTLQSVDTEQQFQLSGMVSDESAVGIGHFLGAKVIITGTFSRYADFSQLSLRAVNVETSALLYSYTARINNADRVLANITAPLGDAAKVKVSARALAHLNSGKNLFAKKKYDEAIARFDKAIAENGDFAEAYFYRGSSYSNRGNKDRAIADFDQAIRHNPNYAEAYYNRGLIYNIKGDNDRAIADFDQAIRHNPNDAKTYISRGEAYLKKEDDDRAFADFDQGIRLDSNADNAWIAYDRLASIYEKKGDIDRAIANRTQLIRIFTELLTKPEFRTNPFVVFLAGHYFSERGRLYQNKGDYDRAIADYESALRIEPKHDKAKTALEQAREARGR